MNAKFNSVLHVTSLGKTGFLFSFQLQHSRDLNYQIHCNAIDWDGIKLISTFRNQSPCGCKASDILNQLPKLTPAAKADNSL